DNLEQFKLVLYGTETSLEFEDDLDRDKPGPPVNHQEAIQDNSAIGARHNAVETEGDPWMGSQQVDRVSHPEVQRPTTENQTSGCSSVEAASGRCLGGCLILLLLAYLTGEASWGNVVTSWREPSNVQCKPNWYHLNGLCVYQCPAKTYGVSDERKSACVPCHYSCLTCSGPSDTECTSCYEDADLSSVNDFQCVLKDLSWTMQSTIWFYRMSILFSINLAVLIAAPPVYMAVNWYSRRKNSLMYRYSKVSYSGNGDAHKDVDRLQENQCFSDSE
ncbi:hypothetical protein WN55_04523, partial [Dufourea novaeangliae]